MYVLGSVRISPNYFLDFYATACHVTCLKTPHILAPNLYSSSLYHFFSSLLPANNAYVHMYKSFSPQILVYNHFRLTLWVILLCKLLYLWNFHFYCVYARFPYIYIYIYIYSRFYYNSDCLTSEDLSGIIHGMQFIKCTFRL